MGVMQINAYFIAHGGLDTGPPARLFRLHRQTPAVDQSWTLTAVQWRALMVDARNGDEADFLAKLKAAVGTWTWTTEMEDAAWQAGQRNWPT